MNEIKGKLLAAKLQLASQVPQPSQRRLPESLQDKCPPQVSPARVSVHDCVDTQQTPKSSEALNVRHFMPNPHANGVSNSVLNVRMHMTRGDGASKEFANKQKSNLDDDERQELAKITKQIGSQGELALKA